MKDMGEQLEDMSSELSKLRVENNSLKNRNTILEKVLALRDEHIRMLQDEQQVRRPVGCPLFSRRALDGLCRRAGCWGLEAAPSRAPTKGALGSCRT